MPVGRRPSPAASLRALVAPPTPGYVPSGERDACTALRDQLHGRAPFTHDPAPYADARRRALAAADRTAGDEAGEVRTILEAGFVRAPWPLAGWCDAAAGGAIVSHEEALAWARKDERR